MASMNLTNVTLPSKGLLYDGINPEFTLKMMGVSEEKMIFGSTNSNAIEKALQSCIVEPKNIDPDQLLAADEHFLLMKLRIHTFGPEYHVVGKCTECGKRNEYDINLDTDLTINTLRDDFKEPIEISLPLSKDKLEVRLLRNKDVDRIEKQAKRIARSSSASQGELEYVMRMAAMIVSINKEIQESPEMAQTYVESMNSYDSAYFWSIMDEVRIGYDSRIIVTCNECGEEYELLVPMNSEFFRPKFRRRKS